MSHKRVQALAYITQLPFKSVPRCVLYKDVQCGLEGLWSQFPHWEIGERHRKPPSQGGYES